MRPEQNLRSSWEMLLRAFWKNVGNVFFEGGNHINVTQMNRLFDWFYQLWRHNCSLNFGNPNFQPDLSIQSHGHFTFIKTTNDGQNDDIILVLGKVNTQTNKSICLKKVNIYTKEVNKQTNSATPFIFYRCLYVKTPLKAPYDDYPPSVPQQQQHRSFSVLHPPPRYFISRSN